ncbi:ComEC/Rec2 family competence protein [Actinomyces israelii]|uniref:ComEC/Rec2 family competence protein n=1 Tax=Actinomyces israelii TaxID=1659 RepID=UPI000AA3CDD1|nr:ComEC/Rec2 family competence protein [Actinomyces israelii]
MSARPGERRSGPHALREAAPAPLDARLLTPALAAWAAAAWATGLSGRGAWRHTLAAALVLAVLALPLGAGALRFRPPRHRRDPRPGAPDAPDGSAVGSVCASLLLAVLAALAVLAVTAAGSWSRAADPLTRAAAEGRAVTIVGAVASEPRVVAGPRRTTVVADLDVTAVDGSGSRLTALVLGGRDWYGLPMGATVRVHAAPRPADPGEEHAAVLGSDAVVRLTARPTGVLALVGGVRAGLADAVGEPRTAPGRWRWPDGARELVSGVALGDDHALPADVRADMRTVSMTHLTAVSGEHVAIVLGLVVCGLGLLPRRWRAVAGALVLAGLVVLVRPGGSVLRAAAMGAVLLAGVALGRRSASLPALGAAVIVLLLIDPWQARSYGFALSVVATAGILLGAAPAQEALARRLPRWAAALLAVPLVAQAACAPVLVLLQPRVSTWAVPANALAAPPVPVATVTGLLAAVVAPWWPALARLIAWPATACCAWLVVVAGFFADLPAASLEWPGGAGGACALAALEAAGAAAASRRGRAGLSRASTALAPAACAIKSALRGRLAPWHRPDAPPEAPGAHQQDPPGTRSTSPRSS